MGMHNSSQLLSKYITRIDADDMREFRSFENLMRIQILNPHSMIYDDVKIFLKGSRQDRDWKMPEYNFNDMLEKNFIHAGSMYPRQAWVDIGGYPEEFSHGRDDWAFNVAMGEKGYCGVRVDYCGYLYRREQQNRTLRNSSADSVLEFKSAMRSRFPDLYAGRFPMGCCGNRQSTVNAGLATRNQRTLSTPEVLGGEFGVTSLQYNGGNYGTEPYYGPVTGIVYKFSVSKNVRNVDNRDLHTAKGTGLLDLHDGPKAIFSVYEAPASSPEPAPEPAPEPSTEEIVEMSVAEPTPIEAGQASGIGPASVKKLSDSGIKDWETFLITSSDQLASTLGFNPSKIEDIKREIQGL